MKQTLIHLLVLGLALGIGLTACKEDAPQTPTTTEESVKPEEKKETPTTSETETPGGGQTPNQGETPSSGEQPNEGGATGGSEQPGAGETPNQGGSTNGNETPSGGETPGSGSETPSQGETPNGGETPGGSEQPNDNNTSSQGGQPTGEGGNDTPPTPPALPEPPAKSEFLVVKFTGQACMYCYSMSSSLRQDEKDHAPNLILVNMHAIARFSPDLYNEQATTYRAQYVPHKTGIPSVSKNLSRDNDFTWMSNMSALPDFVHATTSATLSGRSVSVRFNSQPYRGREANVQGKNLNLIIWAAENDVRQSQINAEGVWLHEYVHQHVFRGSLNGLWGEPVSLGQEYSKTFTLPSSLGTATNGELIFVLIDRDTKAMVDVSRVQL